MGRGHLPKTIFETYFRNFLLKYIFAVLNNKLRSYPGTFQKSFIGKCFSTVVVIAVAITSELIRQVSRSLPFNNTPVKFFKLLVTYEKEL